MQVLCASLLAWKGFCLGQGSSQLMISQSTTANEKTSAAREGASPLITSGAIHLQLSQAAHEGGLGVHSVAEAHDRACSNCLQG